MNKVIHITGHGELQVFADESLAACIREANRLNAESGFTSGVRVVECADGHRMTAADCKATALRIFSLMPIQSGGHWENY